MTVSDSLEHCTAGVWVSEAISLVLLRGNAGMEALDLCTFRRRGILADGDGVGSIWCMRGWSVSVIVVVGVGFGD